jgi:hypothetical protein
VFLPNEGPLGVVSSGGRGDLRSMLRILEEFGEVVIVSAVGAGAIPSMAINWVGTLSSHDFPTCQSGDSLCAGC